MKPGSISGPKLSCGRRLNPVPVEIDNPLSFFARGESLRDHGALAVSTTCATDAARRRSAPSRRVRPGFPVAAPLRDSDGGLRSDAFSIRYPLARGQSLDA